MKKLKYCQPDVVSVKVLENYQLYIEFDDACSGIVNISEIIKFEGIFSPLKDEKYFSSVSINPDIGTICWSNGADLAPAYLYDHLQPKKL